MWAKKMFISLDASICYRVHSPGSDVDADDSRGKGEAE